MISMGITGQPQSLSQGRQENADCCAAHTLAEVYSTLTRMPASHRASADQAMLFLEEMARRLTFIALNVEEYWDAIADAASAGVLGGIDLRRAAGALRVEGQS